MINNYEHVIMTKPTLDNINPFMYHIPKDWLERLPESLPIERYNDDKYTKVGTARNIRLTDKGLASSITMLDSYRLEDIWLCIKPGGGMKNLFIYAIN